jgi:hypothetical protein
LKMPTGIHRERKLPYPQFQGKNYVLEELDIPAFKEFWRSMKTRLAQANELKIGISRFNYAYERSKPEDKLLDYAISFESLVSKKKEGADSLTHKLAIQRQKNCL